MYFIKKEKPGKKYVASAYRNLNKFPLHTVASFAHETLQKQIHWKRHKFACIITSIKLTDAADIEQNKLI